MKKAIIYLMIGLTTYINVACDGDAHEGKRGLVVTVDNSLVNMAIGSVALWAFDAEENPVSSTRYLTAQLQASALIDLPAGAYTLVAAVNMGATRPEDGLMQEELLAWLETESANYGGMMSGILKIDVAEHDITYATIRLVRGAVTQPTMRVVFTLPQPQPLPELTTRASYTGYTLRTVAELYDRTTGECVLRQVQTPEQVSTNQYAVELAANAGNYNLMFWADYANQDDDLADCFYQTENLKAVALPASGYTANIDAKDAAYAYVTGISLTSGVQRVNVRMERPLAKFSLVSTDIEEYRKLNNENPQQYPPLSDLMVTVSYNAYFPTSFNLTTGKPNNAATGISYEHSLPNIGSGTEEASISSDWVLVNGVNSQVSVMLTISSYSGRVICRIPKVQIEYRRNCQTTVRGNFLTAGITEGDGEGSGGIGLDTVWSGEYDVPL